MPSKWHEKKARQAEQAIDRELEEGYGKSDFEALAATDARDAAMGKGEEELFEKKMSKEERKAAAKAAREAKKKAKGPSKNGKKPKESKEEEKADNGRSLLVDEDMAQHKEEKRDAALDRLSEMNINVTYEAKKGKIHANTRDINVSGVTVTFHGKPLIEETDLVINYGNRYGFIGPNGSGKSTIMKAIAARSIPIPDALDIYFLDCEYPARGDITALEAVMESNEEVEQLEQKANDLNDAMADADEEMQEAIQRSLESVYQRLEELDASTAEAR